MLLTNWIRGLGKERAHDVVMAAEIYKLQTAARTLRHMLLSNEYKGGFMCCDLMMSTTVPVEDAQLTCMVIADNINRSGTLVGYLLQNAKHYPNAEGGYDMPYAYHRPVHEDYNFMADHIMRTGDLENEIARILLSNWYWKLIARLEKRANEMLECAK